MQRIRHKSAKFSEFLQVTAKVDLQGNGEIKLPTTSALWVRVEYVKLIYKLRLYQVGTTSSRKNTEVKLYLDHGWLALGWVTIQV